jgi:membrane protein implicated in regulation of membrane protease activity
MEYSFFGAAWHLFKEVFGFILALVVIVLYGAFILACFFGLFAFAVWLIPILWDYKWITLGVVATLGLVVAILIHQHTLNRSKEPPDYLPNYLPPDD